MESESVLRWVGDGEMRLGWMDALYHSPTTETSLSSPFRGHASLSVIARCAKIFRNERKVEDGWLLALTPQVRRRQATTQLLVRDGPSGLNRCSNTILALALNSIL